jgi:hypothetical protein
MTEADKTPLVLDLLEIIQQLTADIQLLKDEIAQLKQHKTKPTVKPNTLETPALTQATSLPKDGKRPGSAKRSKTDQLPIHETQVLPPEDLPPGSTYQGRQRYVVQDLRVQLHNTCYYLERWKTPDGLYRVGQLPAGVRDAGHFGWGLRHLVLYQHEAQQVTQPRLLRFLRDAGVDISAGQLSRLLTEKLDGLHAEKDDLLRVGLQVSSYVHADDTAARHKGQNGYTTHIGNEYFAWFATTASKSRVNFLSLLRGGFTDYQVSTEAVAWMRQQELAQDVLRRLDEAPQRHFADAAAWEQHLDALGVTDERHRKIASEGALLGSALEHGLRPDLVVVSDDAGQFDVWLHALCWVHAERNLNKLIPQSEVQRAALETVRQALWQLYADLKAYKAQPDPQQKAVLAERFDALCAPQTCFSSLTQALKRLQRNKAELLLVLERPELPLHNNLSEQDIRDDVIRRKISGGTRSDLGRRCRDTLASLRKSCRKLGVSFWSFLQDRLQGLRQIPPLGELLRRKATGVASASATPCASASETASSAAAPSPPPVDAATVGVAPLSSPSPVAGLALV